MASAYIDAAALRADLSEKVPVLWPAVSNIARDWTTTAHKRLDKGTTATSFPKTFNDPVWGSIDLLPHELVLLDSPLLQRLRGVRQLGMAHLVYPGAGHDRLEHSRGVVEAAERIMNALERNAGHRRRYGPVRDENVPEIDDLDRVSIRLAALLHDIGHGPFSHATEQLLRERAADDFRAADEVFRNYFVGITKVATSECLAAMLVLTESLRSIFEHANFGASVRRPEQIAPAIAARILGSSSCLQATYLSGVISGPIDADKLDYMARDSHHAGLSLSLDVNRLISKLEVAIVTPDRTSNEALRKAANEREGHRYYELGISLAGISAYEQLIMSRVLLFDRMYYHHKVRAAEAMARELILLVEEEAHLKLDLSELFSRLPDDGFIAYVRKLPGARESRGVQDLADRLASRQLYYRAFAFGSRFISCIGLPEDEQKKTRIKLWYFPLSTLSDTAGCSSMAKLIFDTCMAVGRAIPALKATADELRPEHILVDFPVADRVTIRGGDILTQSQTGQVGTPNLFFDPEKWSAAYAHQKLTGYVFAPLDALSLVNLAAKLVFYSQFGIVQTSDADWSTKARTEGHIGWIEVLKVHGICSAEFVELCVDRAVKLITFREGLLDLPHAWRMEDPALAKRLADALNHSIPGGLPSTAMDSALLTLRHLAGFVDAVESMGTFKHWQTLLERDLQKELLRHLLSLNVPVVEGAEVGGGETDLIVHQTTVVENKRLGVSADPFNDCPAAVWQARRYSIALSSRVLFTVVAYKPADERAYLPKPARIRVLPGPDGYAHIRVAVPWGYGVPSAVAVPASSGSD